VAAALTLAIGIGATTSVFSLVNSIVLAPLPFPHAERLVAVGHTAPGLYIEGTGLSAGTYLHYRAYGRGFAEIAIYHESVVNLAGGGAAEAERVPVATVSHTFFSVLGARAAAGRLPTAADADGSGERVVLLSHDLWARRYGADPAIVGATIEANRQPRRVLGVLEPGFAFPRRDVGIWYPSDPDPAVARASDLYQQGIARLEPGWDTAAAERELNRLVASLPEAYPDLTARTLEESRLRAVVRPLAEEIVGETGAVLWLLLGGMALLLLIAGANVANLFLVRGEHRQREIAVRTTLGAGRRHLARAFAAEGLILAAAGGAAGLLVAVAAVRGLVAHGVPGLPRLDEVSIDGRVVAFAAGTSVVIALLVALLPLLRYARPDLAVTLREGGFGATATRERQRARKALVAAQVALALTLLVGSALMAQSFWRLTRADPGFEAVSLLTAEIALPRAGYEDYAAARRLWEALVERVEALPGVAGAAAAGGIPLVPQPAFHDLAIDVEGRPGEPRAAVTVHHVTPGYFAVMGIPLVAGQGVRSSGAPAERPVLLSAAAARRLFPGQQAVGKRIRRSVSAGADSPWATVAGVVGDVPREHVGGEPAEIVYLPILDEAVDPGLRPSYGTLVVRTEGSPSPLAPAIREVVRALDPDLPLASVQTMERVVAASMARTTFTLLLLGLSGAAALFLGVVGLYGVISYSVSRRTHELGIRVALGAGAGDVRRVVLREGISLACYGVAVGSVTTLGLTRFLGGLLFEVTPTDPLSYAAMAALLLLVAGLASSLPAWRAARVDPIAALRME
ncbi:MAG TPA: ADOP family duplicated permease, partial [Thermoanaerobaculia bacterium]|nr:ADOP family duplicated permease [Thermoanaerobaculia bacterium]